MRSGKTKKRSGLHPLLAGMVVLTLASVCANAAPTVTPLHALTGDAVYQPSRDPHDLSGIWAPAAGMLGLKLPTNVKPGESPINNGLIGQFMMTPGTEATVERHRVMAAGGSHVATPHLTCRPTGIEGITALKFPVMIVQSPQEISFLMEEDRDVYHVFLNRGHDPKLKPSYDGDSVAHWEGDTLVVDTTNYNGLGMIDESWHPSSVKTHMVQRLKKAPDGKALDLWTTIYDPANYTAPIQMHVRWLWASGDRQSENDCSEFAHGEDVKFVYENPLYRPVCVAHTTKTGDQKVVCKMPSESP